MESEATLQGKLIVATPGLADPNFFRTVVLVVEHGEQGAAGVVLNRPTPTELADGPLEGWKEVAADPALVFVGGPVAPDAAVCLARVAGDRPPAGWHPVLRDLGVLDLSNDPGEVQSDIDRVRLFAGYAGWIPGQLESEIGEGSWYVFDADPEDALSPQPGGLWRFVLKRQGGKLAVVANFPADPAMN